MLTSGVADVAFIDNTLYGLLSGAGCSHGVPSIPNQVFRVNGNGTPTMIANLSHYYQTQSDRNEEEDDFEPDGTPYSMIAVRGDLYVVEPNHGSLDRVSLDGTISRVADISATMGHIVPTTVSYHGDFFVGNLGTFPVDPGSEQILKVTPSGQLKPWVTVLTMVLGSVWDSRGRLYVLESSTVAGNPTPVTGRIRRMDPSGEQRRSPRSLSSLGAWRSVRTEICTCRTSASARSASSLVTERFSRSRSTSVVSQ